MEFSKCDVGLGCKGLADVEFCPKADPTRTIGMASVEGGVPKLAGANRDTHDRYHGSDDDLRSRFEEYICSALSAIKYSDFMASGQATDPVMMGMPGGESVCKHAISRTLHRRKTRQLSNQMLRRSCNPSPNLG